MSDPKSESPASPAAETSEPGGGDECGRGREPGADRGSRGCGREPGSRRRPRVRVRVRVR